MTLIGGDASRLANRFTALGNVLGVDGDTVARHLQQAGNDAHCAAILDTACSARAAQSPAHDPLVVTLQALPVAGPIHEVGDLADAAGVDRRLHSKATAPAPALSAYAGGDPRSPRRAADALIDPEYYDQAHFTHDSHAYMGTSPTAYFTAPREVLRRAATERLRVIGAPVQGLHAPPR